MEGTQEELKSEIRVYKWCTHGIELSKNKIDRAIKEMKKKQKYTARIIIQLYSVHLETIKLWFQSQYCEELRGTDRNKEWVFNIRHYVAVF